MSTFLDSCESYVDTAGMATKGWSLSASAPTPVASGGAFGGNYVSLSAGQQMAVGATAEGYSHVAMWIRTPVLGSSRVCAIVDTPPSGDTPLGGSMHASFVVNPNGEFAINKANNTALFSTGAGIFTANQWHHVEIIIYHSNTGYVDSWVDGVAIGRVSNDFLDVALSYSSLFLEASHVGHHLDDIYFATSATAPTPLGVHQLEYLDGEDVFVSAGGQLSIVNPDGETGDNTGWTAESGEALQVRSANPDPYEGAQYFWFGTGAGGKAYQDLNLLALGNTASNIDSGNVTFILNYQQSSYDGSDTGQMTVRFLEADQSTVIGAEIEDGLIAASTTWEPRQIFVEHIPANARYVRIAMDSVLVAGNDANAGFDAITATIQPFVENEARITRQSLEVVTSTATTPETRITRQVAEVVTSTTATPETRISAIYAEVVTSLEPKPMDVSKATAYAILKEKGNVAKVAKATAYAVLKERPPHSKVSKATAYAILREFDKTKQLNVKKLSLTAVLSRHVAATRDEVSLTENASGTVTP